MTVTIGRRELLVALGGAAAAWPLAARAQQPDRTRRIAVLMTNNEGDPEGKARADALRQGLRVLGWTEGQNLRIDWRWSGGDVGHTRGYAAEVAGLAPDVIVANGSPNLAAIKQATRSIPVIFVVVSDPVGQGFVSSLAHPGGNITGFTYVEYSSLSGKWLDLLKTISPSITRVIYLFNPAIGPRLAAYFRSSFEAAALALSLKAVAGEVQNATDIELVLQTFAREPNGGLLVVPDPFTTVNRQQIVGLAERYRLPALYPFKFFAMDGGLMSYGLDVLDEFRQTASYVDRVLRGANPADLPVQVPTKYELVINLKTAKALGLEVPLQLQQLADEVIE